MREHTETKERLLDTAIQLIWRSNYSNVGVNDICEQAGVTKGSFYYYFQTKADLFYEACEHYWESMKKDLDAIFSPTFTPQDQLENLIQYVIKRQETAEHGDGNPVSGCPFFTSGGQAGSDEERVRDAAREMADKGVRYGAALVRNLKAGDALNSDPDPEQVGRLIHQFIQGLLLFGRVYFDLGVVRTDLREGLYRLVDLKAEFRRSWPKLGSSSLEQSPALSIPI